MSSPSPTSPSPSSAGTTTLPAPPSPAEAELILQRSAAAARLKQRHGQERDARQRIDLTDVEAVRRRLSVVADDEAARNEAATKSWDEQDKLRDRIAASDVPGRYLKASLDDLSRVPDWAREKYAEAVRRLRRVLQRPAIVALLGSRGPGKTWMACGLVLEVCRLPGRKQARYLDALDYFESLKATYGPGAKRETRRVEQDFLDPVLLVIDGLEERADTPWEDRMLTRLIVKRHNAGLATVLVSNDTERKFGKRIGDTVQSRMKEGGGVIVCGWGDLRGKC